MGFIKAFAGSLGGSLGDQWLDFLMPPEGLPPTAAVFPAVAKGQNAGRGSNTKGSENIITNGSKIVVPEGYGLLTFQEGQLTGFVAEAGGYEFRPDDPQSQSLFAGDGIVGIAGQAVVGALQVRRAAGRSAPGVLREPEGAAEQPLRHPVRDLLGRRVPRHAGGCDHPRHLHAEDRRPGAVREGLRALRVLRPRRAGVRLHRPGQRRRDAAVQRGRLVAGAGVLALHERPRQGQPHGEHPERLARASRSRCPRPSKRVTSGGPPVAWRS